MLPIVLHGAGGTVLLLLVLIIEDRTGALVGENMGQIGSWDGAFLKCIKMKDIPA